MRTHCIWDLQCFQTFRNGCLFCTLWLIRDFYSGHGQHVQYGKHSLNHHFQKLRTLGIRHLQCFQSFRNGCLFCTYWHIRTFYSGDAHHANYGKHSSNHHFQHCSQCVSEIHSVFEVFVIAVSFAYFAFYGISTLVMRIILTMANIV